MDKIIRKEPPGIKDLVPEKKDNIVKTIKKVDHYFLSFQESTDTWREKILKNEVFVISFSFGIGIFLAWVFSECTTTIIFTTSHRVLIAIVIVLATLLMISSKKVELAYAAMLIVSVISGLLFGEISLSWDSTTYEVITNGICKSPVEIRDFLVYVLGATSGMLYLGKRYKLF